MTNKLCLIQFHHLTNGPPHNLQKTVYGLRVAISKAYSSLMKYPHSSIGLEFGFVDPNGDFNRSPEIDDLYEKAMEYYYNKNIDHFMRNYDKNPEICEQIEIFIGFLNLVGNLKFSTEYIFEYVDYAILQIYFLAK